MNKKLLIFISVGLVFLSLSCKAKELEKNIISIPIENRKIPYKYEANKYQYKKEFSFKEMMEDLDTFIYLLESSYAGYEDALSRGMDVKKIKNQFQSKYGKDEKIQIDDFYETLYAAFIPYIQDCHANLNYNEKYNAFIKDQQIFFSDIYVKKRDSFYFVINQNQLKIPADAKFNDDEKYLFYYPAKGQDVYRIGYLQAENKESISIKFDNQKYELPLKKAENVDEPCLYFVKSTDKSSYIKYNRCEFENETELNYQKAFSNSSKDYKDKEFLIFDLRGNYGGDNYYEKKFFLELYNENMKTSDFLQGETRNIYSYANIKAFRHLIYIYTDVKSPQIKEMLNDLKAYEKIIKRKPQKIIEISENKDSDISFDNPDFKGKIILLTDKNVASSGEDFVLLADKIFGETTEVIQIGQNTSGCILYGNICDFYLPNSGIKCRLNLTDFSSIAKQSKRFHGEGNGLYPDYWSTNEDLNDSIFLVTKDQQMYELLKDVL